MALYTITVLFGDPSFLARDSVHVGWLGFCKRLIEAGARFNEHLQISAPIHLSRPRPVVVLGH